MESESIDISENLKGMIRFPCHKDAKILVYEGTVGMASIQCPYCKQICVFDYSSMTAARSKKICGGVKAILNKSYH
mgnify:CR=1 FL=1